MPETLIAGVNTPRELPPRTDSPVYGVEQLEKFVRLTRANYLTYTGQQAKPHRSADEADALAGELGIDPIQALEYTRIKRWCDLSVPDDGEVYLYDSVAIVAGQARWNRHATTNRFARWLNLPGKYDYPKWDQPPSGAYSIGYDGARNYLSTQILCTRGEADQVAADLGAKVALRDFPAFPVIYEPTEKRRMWGLDMPDGTRLYAAFLCAQRYRDGVGAPGHWEGLAWVSETDPDVGEWDSRPEVPVPCRQLAGNEIFRPSFGGLIQIVNMELAEPSPIQLSLTLLSELRSLRALIEERY